MFNSILLITVLALLHCKLSDCVAIPIAHAIEKSERNKNDIVSSVNGNKIKKMSNQTERSHAGW